MLCIFKAILESLALPFTLKYQDYRLPLQKDPKWSVNWIELTSLFFALFLCLVQHHEYGVSNVHCARERFLRLIGIPP